MAGPIDTIYPIGDNPDPTAALAAAENLLKRPNERRSCYGVGLFQVVEVDIV